MTTYLKAHYPQGHMFERFEGSDSDLYGQITDDLFNPHNFIYEVSDNPVDDFCSVSLDDIKSWA